MYTKRGRRARGLIGGIAVTALGLSLCATPSAATSVDSATPLDPVEPSLDAAAATSGAITSTVTLITGDTVTVITRAGKTDVTVGSGGSDAGIQMMSGPDGDTYVYPHSALTGIASGQLDRELFNITELIADGYGDKDSPTIPVIVQYSDKAGPATLEKRAKALPAATGERPLRSVRGAGMRVSKSKSGEFFSSLGIAPGHAADASARKLDKVWLDQKVSVALEESVPQIGAPEAWADGHDGTGVTVAVLDTGVDETHPDLVGQLRETRSFVPGETVKDGHGHGTHVAATIAGTGAGSDGRRKGVAPGADLLVGKVLSDAGSGAASGIIAGMEWAAASGADIVSMSLGAQTTSAHDVMSDAVDQLSASYNTLFVIAAGNEGSLMWSNIGSPGTADSALTVGAVSKTDQMAPFSSWGPRAEDYGLKPEITAPGVDIVAARAAGTSMGTVVDERYTSASGTSMATPHVAGAAALVKQARPELAGARLKDALVSTSTRLPAAQAVSIYRQGVGRVRALQATSSPVLATAKADFGAVYFKEGGDNPAITRTVTYTNHGDEELTLDLSLEFLGAERHETPPVEGEVVLSHSTVTVPAGGSADVTLAVQRGLGDPGRHSGWLSATADGVSLTTGVAYVRRPPQVDVTVTGFERHGDVPDAMTVVLTRLDDASGEDSRHGVIARDWGDGHTFTTSVPKGRYAIDVVVQTARWYPPVPEGGRRYIWEASDFYHEPELVIEGDTDLSVDARRAVDIESGVTGEARAVHEGWKVAMVEREVDLGARFILERVRGDSSETSFGVIPAASKAAEGTVRLVHTSEPHDPLVTATIVGSEMSALDLLVPDDTPRQDATLHLKAVDVGAGTDEDFSRVDVGGKLAVVTTAATDVAGSLSTRAAHHGAKAVIIVPPQSGPNLIWNGTGPVIPVVAASYESGQRLLSKMKAGPTRVKLELRRESRFTYRLPALWEGDSLPANPEFTPDVSQFATVTSTFNAQAEQRLGARGWNSQAGGQKWSIVSAPPVMTPAVIEEHIYARGVTYSDTAFHGGSTDPDYLIVSARPESYQPGSQTKQDWFRGPLAAGDGLTDCSFCRSPDGLSLAFSALVDADPRHYSVGVTGQASMRLYRNDEPVTALPVMVPEDASYRLEYELHRPGSLATMTSTAWSFRSAAPTSHESLDCMLTFEGQFCGSLPVIMVGYDVPLDASNKAKAGHPLAFTISTSRTKGFTGDAAVSGIKVSASFDDGATWTPAAAQLGAQGVHPVTVKHPNLKATKGFVSLRVEVWDDAGNRTLQTITRAYGLR